MKTITRRELLRNGAIAAIVSQSACHRSCLPRLAEAGGTVINLLWGQDPESERKIFAVADEVRAQDSDSHSLTSQLGAGRPAPRQSSPLPLDGIVRGGIGGCPPGGDRTDPIRSFYLVETQGDQQIDARVYAIDTDGTTISLRGEIPLGRTAPGETFIDLRDVFLSPDSNLLILPRDGAQPEWIFADPASLSVIGRLPAPDGRFMGRRGVFAPDGRQFFAISYAQRTGFRRGARINVIDSSERRLVGAIDVPEDVHIEDLVFSPDGVQLFGVGNSDVSVYDPAAGVFSGENAALRGVEQPGGGFFGGFDRAVMHYDGHHLYAGLGRTVRGDIEGRAIGVIDTRSLSLVSQIDVDETGNTVLMAAAEDGPELFYGSAPGTRVAAIDSETQREFASISAGGLNLAGFAIT